MVLNCQNSNDEFFNYKYLKRDCIEYRDYQVNIAESSFQKNTLVVLPTALGKTIIGIILAAKYLDRFKGSKILVLAPTKPLVLQHYESFVEFFMDKIELNLLIGNIKPVHRALRFNNSEILFSTPQIIKNDLIRGSINLHDFSLVIFDEAHKARKNYAYTFIAEEYINTGKKPFILALTASPGKDSEIINTLIQKLYIERVCFRNEENLDVKDYVFPIELLVERLDMPIEILQIHILLQKAVQDIIDYFIGKNILSVKSYYSKVDFIRLNQDLRTYEMYGDNYSEFHFPMIPQILNQNPLMRFTFVSMAISGIYLLHMDEILTTQNPSMFVDYIDKLKLRADSGSKSASRILKSKYYTNYIEKQTQSLRQFNSPKIGKTIELITDIFDRKEDSKVIIFTQFRDMASILMEKIKNLNDKRMRPSRFVGQFSKPNDKGMTQNQQKEMIKIFKEQKVSILIATSIAEEGLDIPNVDAVIFYEPVPSEIRLIQRRGRTGRSSKGLCHILCMNDSLDSIYLNVAFKKEQIMHQTLINDEELDLISELNRSEEKFSPGHKSDSEILNFFNDLEERKKLKSKKNIEMIDSINNSDSEKRRVKLLENYGVNDLTSEIGEISKKRISKTEKNLKSIKEEKLLAQKLRRQKKIEKKIQAIRNSYKK